MIKYWKRTRKYFARLLERMRPPKPKEDLNDPRLWDPKALLWHPMALVGEAPETLHELGRGVAWVAEHKSGMGGLGGSNGLVHTRGFADPNLYVFPDAKTTQAFIERNASPDTHYPVCHEWVDDPPGDWESQWDKVSKDA